MNEIIVGIVVGVTVGLLASAKAQIYHAKNIREIFDIWMDLNKDTRNLSTKTLKVLERFHEKN